MSELKNVSAALVKAQRAFGPALKANTNPHFKSKYADLAACIEAVVDALNENGIALVQRLHQCESGVSVETLFVHESGEQLSAGVFSVPAAKQDPQGYGSALTYARRYSLMAACGHAPEDDDGNAGSKPRKPSAVSVDDSPAARAARITQGVANGDASGAALAMSEWQKNLLDAVWLKLDDATQAALLKAWPKDAAA